MAFVSLRTWVSGEVVTAALLNAQIRDNGAEYTQRDGSIPLTAGWDVGAYEITALKYTSDQATGTAPLTVASTTVVTNLNADTVDAQHRVININADHTHQTTGAQAGKIDHGLALDGLGDDDHTQYQKESLLTTAGDMPFATADSTWDRLAIGTALQYLRTNAGATAPEWTTGIISTKLKSETRARDAASGDVAYTGYGFQPKALIVLGGYSNSMGLGGVDLNEFCHYLAADSVIPRSSAADIIYFSQEAGVKEQHALLKTLDADGFTLTWTKVGSPTSTTDAFAVLAIA